MPTAADPRITIRLTPELEAALQAVATARGTTPATVARQALVDLLTPAPQEPVALPEGSDRTLNVEQRAVMTAKRERRQEAAHRHGVAIGWIDEHGKLLPGATRMDGSRPLNLP